MGIMMRFLAASFILGGAHCSPGGPVSTSSESVIQCLTASNVPQALPGTPEFAKSSSPHNLRLRFTPLAIAVPSTVSHVQAAVACGRQHGVKVNARSGGHSYASHGIGGEDGHLVIDLRLLNQVIVDPDTKVATVGPGAKLGNMAIQLDAQGKRLIPHGICPKVGVGGHVLHGGWGYATHNHGLFLDYLEEVQVVTANSSVVIASDTQNPHLFWALRGAGMSFAIATRFRFRTLPQPDEIQLFYIPFSWTLPQAKAGWRVFQDYVASKARPKEMNIRVVMASAALLGGEGTFFLFEGAYHGSKTNYEVAIKPFKDAAMALGGFAVFLNIPEVTSVGYMDSLLYANNNALWNISPDAEPTAHPSQFFKSMVTDKLSDATTDALMEALHNGSQTNPDRTWLWITSAIGGPNSAMSTMFLLNSTSYSHRSSLLLWEIGDMVNATSSYPADVGIPWVNQFVDIVEKKEGKGVGMYYNYADPTIGHHEAAGRRYWPGNYERLAELKRVWDEGGVFENPQSVGL
ncbi:hypothetical protein B0H67DRAFT_532709 [Lasiosphaeris hirsuta]|uniref:FAD-binding PCMH-type domain-containing protein n=1 Tax=Lasiosphaeris hirsuta TaxID=260670 RepID=A0AA40ANJ1_9PEZI|nr:hypothetical protein B0H67DRAFT_532709 [Lasiosphaeris hirsuta]